MNVPVLNEAGALLAGYDVLISDVWGVVHDGLWALEPACAALMRFREAGGTVVLLSNAPGPSEQIAGVLDRKRVPRQAWDRLVTSGDVTRALITESHQRNVYHIGWAEDRAVFAGLDVALVGEEEADIVVATELNDYRNETPEQYRPLLQRFAARGLPVHLRQSRSRRPCRRGSPALRRGAGCDLRGTRRQRRLGRQALSAGL